MLNGIDWGEALGVRGMFVRLYAAGYSGEDLKDMVGGLKNGGFERLDRFADGELSKAKGRAEYPILLEATALRYILAQSETKGEAASVAVRTCSHGFVGHCSYCLREAS